MKTILVTSLLLMPFVATARPTYQVVCVSAGKGDSISTTGEKLNQELDKIANVASVASPVMTYHPNPGYFNNLNTFCATVTIKDAEEQTRCN